MSTSRDFAVVTRGQLHESSPTLRRQPLSIQTKLRHQQQQAQKQISDANETKSQLKRSSAMRKTVRFTPSTSLGSEKDEVSPQEPADTDIFTRSPHASHGSVSSIDFPDHLRPILPSAMEQTCVEILQPVTYSPDSPGNIDERITAAIKTGIIRSDTVRHKVGVLEYSHRALPQVPQAPQAGRNEGAGLQIDTESHKRNLSTSSATDQPRRKKTGSSGSREIYFTPTDVNSTRIFLSSPLNSPTLPLEVDGESEDDLPTPRATVAASLTRPPSAIFVGRSVDEAEAKHGDVKDKPENTPEQSQSPRQTAIQITPEQLDRLIVALAQSKLVRKHLSKDWFDLEGVPDTDSIVSSFSHVSLPTLTSASSLYSRQNTDSPPVSDGAEPPRYSLEDPHLEQAKGEIPHAPRTSGGLLICDPKIYGTPAKFASVVHKSALGSRTFLTAPDSSEVECSLRVAPASSANANVRVFLTCVCQIVDRKSGKQASILSAEIDVTERIVKAALSELAEGTSVRVEDIAICASPTTAATTTKCPSITPDVRSSILSSNSSLIDWLAIADDLQARDQIASMIETAVSVLHNLSSETASPCTHNLLIHLSRLADQHHDLLILRPTSYHADGVMPHTIKIPHCSRRIFEDWYTDPRGSQAGEKIGESQAARMFQRGIVTSVAKRAGEKESFKIEVFWEKGGRMRQVLRIVPMVGGEGGEERIWCCFVLGERDLSE
ncbi:hypothetical protein CKM354_000533500 [Cercospora kikuchii]|uniref:Uncharacterized protein n=1 Tax=Cercospora kikuchii TaxID=84275 RepID=A0A9P3CLT2_9PEZI|nr:uncharacterized protein CKM354_000533500 [Cercospora kikuchii]GIZ42055.1 hypothetical protein CKM354_000533500 [Cercospora kikuchii]